MNDTNRDVKRTAAVNERFTKLSGVYIFSKRYLFVKACHDIFTYSLVRICKVRLRTRNEDYVELQRSVEPLTLDLFLRVPAVVQTVSIYNRCSLIRHKNEHRPLENVIRFELFLKGIVGLGHRQKTGIENIYRLASAALCY